MEKITFNDLPISNNIKQALVELGYLEMTPIQEAALPTILAGKDVIAQAPTGTGKTCCYAIPICNSINVEDSSVQALVLCPTRELAIQVAVEMQKVAKYLKDFRIVNVYGGQDIEIQIRSLKKKPQVIVGTPGRIMDHMRRHTLKLENIKTLVLDEADEMLDMGFKEDLDVILEDVKTEHQTILFSATMPDTIKKITKLYQKDAEHIKTTFQDTVIPDIQQYYVEVDERNKVDCLSRMIDTYNFKQALVFCRTKRKVDDLSFALTSRGYPVECIHGDMRQTSREKVMKLFREGLVHVLIATDVAARGLDIDGIDVVFNFDITDDVEYYIHRIGRTARAGRAGCSYTFVSKKEANRIKDFAKTTKTEIVKIDPPTYKVAEKRKMANKLAELFASMGDNDYSEYTNAIYSALLDTPLQIEIEDVAGAFLKQLITSDSKFGDAGLDLTISTSNRSTPNDYTRLFINLGRVDKLSRAELAKLVSDKHYVENSQVLGIDIKNTYSFFAVPTVKVEAIIEYLNNEVYNGRKVDTQISNPEKSVDKGQKSSYSKSNNSHKNEERVRPQRIKKEVVFNKKPATDTPKETYEKKYKKEATFNKKPATDTPKEAYETKHKKELSSSKKASLNMHEDYQKKPSSRARSSYHDNDAFKKERTFKNTNELKTSERSSRSRSHSAFAFAAPTEKSRSPRARQDSRSAKPSRHPDYAPVRKRHSDATSSSSTSRKTDKKFVDVKW